MQSETPRRFLRLPALLPSSVRTARNWIWCLALATMLVPVAALSEQVPSRQSQDWWYQDTKDQRTGIRYQSAFTMDTKSPYNWETSFALTYFPDRNRAMFGIRAAHGNWPANTVISYQVDGRQEKIASDLIVSGTVASWAANVDEVKTMVSAREVLLRVRVDKKQVGEWRFSLAGFAVATKEIRELMTWPELSVDEMDVLSRISGTAMTGVLSDSDLRELRSVVDSYTRRTGRPIPSSDVEAFTIAMESVSDYNSELGRCLLQSLDSKQPVISQRLEELTRQVVANGTRQAKADADRRMIHAAASGEPYADEFGDEYEAPTREDILESLRHVDQIKANMKMYRDALAGTR